MEFYLCLLLLLGFFLAQERVNGAEENSALLGITSQSTLFSNWYAQLAVDGIRTSCSHTQSQNSPWWRVDLLKPYSVNRVVITNRQDCCSERINGAEIHVGNFPADIYSNPRCAVITSIPAGASYTYSCGGMEGRYVYVVIPGNDTRILTLCEVEIYGYLPGNLAIGRSVTQSSTYTRWYAEQAIDGNRGFIQSSSACSSTSAETNPWWRLDLRHVYKVSRVVITNRKDCCPERINGAEIHIGNSLEENGNINPICAVISSIPAGVSSTYFCNDMEGRYVNLVNPGESRFLTLCEVEVYGTGPYLKDSFMKIKFKSSTSLTEPSVRVKLLTQLESALADQGISDVTLRWTQSPKPEVIRSQSGRGRCVTLK